MLCERIPNELDVLILSLLNRESGVGNVLGVLSALQEEISLYLEEIVAMLDAHSQNTELLESRIEASKQDVLEINNSLMLFGKRSRLWEAKQDLEDVVVQLVKNKLEIARKGEVKIIFSLLYEYIMEKDREYKYLKSKLESLLSDYNEQISYLVNQNNDKEFVIELMNRYAHEIKVEDSELDYDNFFKELCRKDEEGLSDLMSMDSHVISRKFFDIALYTDTALKWRNIEVEKVLAEMCSEERVNLFEQAIHKTSVLLNYDYRSYKPNYSLSSTFVVGVKDKSSSIVITDNLLNNLVSQASDNTLYTCTNNNNSIIFYRQLYTLLHLV